MVGYRQGQQEIAIATVQKDIRALTVNKCFHVQKVKKIRGSAIVKILAVVTDGAIKIEQIFGVIYSIKMLAQVIKIGKSVMEQ